MQTTHLPYRPNVCIILRNRNGQVLLGERLGTPGAWQFPQGGIDEDELDAEQAVYREINEELGITREHIERVTKLSATHTYDFNTPPRYAVGKWRGQTQTFWLVHFRGNDNDINIATSEPEFSSWRWCAPDEVLDTVEPIRRAGYIAPLNEIIEKKEC